MRIKLTEPAEIAGKVQPADAELTVAIDTGRYLIARKKAILILAEAAPATPAPSKTRRTRSKA